MLHPGSHVGFPAFVGLSVTGTVGLVMEIITRADKAWQGMKERAIKAPALALPGTQRGKCLSVVKPEQSFGAALPGQCPRKPSFTPGHNMEFFKNSAPALPG